MGDSRLRAKMTGRSLVVTTPFRFNIAGSELC